MENKIKRIPIARCPNPDCSRTLLFSCDPKDKLRITTKIADESYQGKTMICSRCKTTVAIYSDFRFSVEKMYQGIDIESVLVYNIMRINAQCRDYIVRINA